jgi:ABC-type Fe3+/spermidine/putrescine transport system ATPase subunit
VVAGLMPYQGSVLMDGRSLDRVPPHLRGVGLLFQELFLFPHLTVAGNLVLAMERREEAGADKVRRAGELLDMLNIGDLADRRPDRLGGGEKQRAARARDLADRAAVIQAGRLADRGNAKRYLEANRQDVPPAPESESKGLMGPSGTV